MKDFKLLVLIAAALAMMAAPAALAETKSAKSADNAACDSVSCLKLRGTVFTKSFKPMAIIEDSRTGNVTMYEVGEEVEGFTVADIVRGEVLMKGKSGEYRLALPKGGIPQAVTATGEEEKWYSIAKDGDTFITDQSTVYGAISRVVDIMKNVKVRPHFYDGKRDGIIIDKMTEKGILKEIGLKQGDVIRSVNGLKIETPHQIFTVYRKLKDSPEIKVDFVRATKPLAYTYKIK